MRITFVMPFAGLSGGIRVVAHFARELSERGHEVVAVSVPKEPVRLRENIRGLLRGKGWQLNRSRHPSHFDAMEAVEHRVIDSARPIIDSDLPDADVVIATWWETAQWVHALSPSKGVKAYFIQQYEANFGFPDADVAATWRLPLHKIVCSQWLAELAQKRFGQRVDHVVHNGVDLGLFQGPPRGKQAAPTVGLMYAHNTVKGCEVSFAAFAKAKAAAPDLQMIAFGNERLIDRLPLPERTSYFFTPPQEKIVEIYNRCDAWLCGSRSEGFHLPPHEAMACRTPVVSTRVGGPMDMIESGVNGFLCEPDDVDGLADGMVRIAKMGDGEWRRMSEAALATARRFNWEIATDRFEAALHSILGHADRKPAGVLPVKQSAPAVEILEGSRAS